jgi:hypothetical protein
MINNFIKIPNPLSSSSEIEFNPRTFSCKGVRIMVFNATFNNISGDTWKMKVNVDKRKIVVFSKGQLPRKSYF